MMHCSFSLQTFLIIIMACIFYIIVYFHFHALFGIYKIKDHLIWYNEKSNRNNREIVWFTGVSARHFLNDSRERLYN